MSSKKTKTQVMKRRNRNTLTFYEKIAVIRHHDANQLSRNNLARMFQCCTTQIRKILERKDELLAQWQTMSETNASAAIEEMSKKRREFEMKAAGFILHQWVERCRDLELNMVINDETLKLTAVKLATVLNIPDFKPSGRWIERFRLKYKYKSSDLANPRNLQESTGTLSVEDIIIEFKNFLPSFMRQEISNITSNDIEVSEVSLESEECQNHCDEQRAGIPEEDNTSRTDTHSPEADDTNDNNSTAENVIQYLSTIQQFLLSNSDFQGMAVAVSLSNHIEEKYICSKQSDDEGTVVLIE